MKIERKVKNYKWNRTSRFHWKFAKRRSRRKSSRTRSFLWSTLAK